MINLAEHVSFTEIVLRYIYLVCTLDLWRIVGIVGVDLEGEDEFAAEIHA